MGEIVKFKPKPKPKPRRTELEIATHDIVGKLADLVDGHEHINVTVGILLVDDDYNSTDITLSNQTQHIDVVHYETGTNPTLNEALNKDKIPETEDT